MAYQTVFKRYELKYMLTARQKELLLRTMEPYMRLDTYGRSIIRNVYYDTDTYRLIRQSLEKPVYKEKLRVRSYVKAGRDSPVFVELKKKYDGVVYKRRVVMPEQQAADWMAGTGPVPLQTQIAKEIDYFRRFYETLRPAVFLSYEREAFYSPEGGDFRITFDENILYRQDSLSLAADVWGTSILEKDRTLMELKTSGGIPLWLTRFLTRQRLFKTSFSKYGTAYQDMTYSKLSGGRLYA